MTYHGVLIPEAIAAMNVDSYNRHVIDTGTSASPVDNGWVFFMDSKHTSGSLTEVWELGQPITGSLSGLWMAYSGDEIVLTDARYKGLDPDPRNFYNEANKVFSAFKPQVGDIILVTGEALGGSYVAGGTTHVNATTGTFKLTFGTSQTAGVTSFEVLGAKYISLATGAIDNQRVTAYELECVAN